MKSHWFAHRKQLYTFWKTHRTQAHTEEEREETKEKWKEYEDYRRAVTRWIKRKKRETEEKQWKELEEMKIGDMSGFFHQIKKLRGKKSAVAVPSRMHDTDSVAARDAREMRIYG